MSILETVKQRQKEAEQVKQSGVIDRIEGTQEPTMKVTVNKKIDDHLTFVGIDNFDTDDELAHYHRKDGFGF